MRNRTPNVLITNQLLCQLSYGGVVSHGVKGGARTHSHGVHSPALYQLSYLHRVIIISPDHHRVLPQRYSP